MISSDESRADRGPLPNGPQQPEGSKPAYGSVALHHVQVGCPAGGEDAACHFCAGCLGLTEVTKPAALADRGGAWFRGYAGDGRVSAELHLGVEEPFRPARKAHPALLLPDARALGAVAERLRRGGYEVDQTERDTFPGYARLHVRDPHGNRVELLCPAQ